uniref:FCP1 homology domain-containing protein n=1 Tax=viral metagenome TaxID=1070528 RepID=A0A6C0EAT6_9ZZZZ
MKISKEKTLIILDWDDTLFPTSWIVKNQLDISNVHLMVKYTKYFSKLDEALYRLLTRLQKCGTVIIVTNALPEWVRLSSKLLPQTQTIVRTLKIVSARKIYQDIVSNYNDWKKYAFNDQLNEIDKRKKINNIISVGDAEYEYNALISLHKNDKMNYKILKSIKFVKSPSNLTLLDQITVLHNAVPHICMIPKHADMKFEIYNE